MITPEEDIEKLKITHQIDMENKEIEYKHDENRDVIKSCCFQLRQSSLLFFGKLFISVFTMFLCSYQLITLRDCSYQTLYSGIMGLVIGAWLK